ncbi:acyl-CoA carboxylase subunit epsilon [Mycobacterium parmense]|uniref:acyl-CoA carboxylase subunit epsilon n=1 Tax=Mycobacterium parmense TaxID=185642 RepID=UPI001E33B90C|nr:acyl-CoA carboxylase subunit epsilon [Mycobacterium parmense]
MSDGIEANQPHQPHIQILSGKPTDRDIAALVVVLAGAGRTPEPPPAERTRWGLPADRLRYAVSNFQRLTMQQRLHMQHMQQ